MSTFNQRMNAIGVALEKFENQMTVVRPTDLVGFIARRVELSRAVKVFLAEEWDDLANRISQDLSKKNRSAKTALHSAFVSLRADYSRHVAQWNSTELVKDWDGYRADCQGLIRAMRRLLEMRAGNTLRSAA